GSDRRPEARPPMELDHRYVRIDELGRERAGGLETAHQRLDRRRHTSRHLHHKTLRAPGRQVQHDVHHDGTWTHVHESRPASWGAPAGSGTACGGQASRSSDATMANVNQVTSFSALATNEPPTMNPTIEPISALAIVK